MKAILVDIAQSQNLNLDNKEKTMVVKMEEWIVPDYENMTLEDLLSEDNKSSVVCASMEEIRVEKEENACLDAVLNLQDRMAKGMKMIKEFDSVRIPYVVAANKFNRAKEVMFADESKKPQSWWNRFNQLKAERNVTWEAFEPCYERLNKLWKHWLRLKDECNEIATPEVWVQFFSLAEQEINTYFTHEGDEGIDHLTAQDEEAFAEWKIERENCERDSHIDEMREYDMEVHLPIKTGGYVPPCRDVTHLYTTNEEWESILASCPF